MNISFAPVHVRANAIKFFSVFTGIFFSETNFYQFNTVRSLSVCDAIKSVNSAHYIRRVFPVTYGVHACYPKTDVF